MQPPREARSRFLPPRLLAAAAMLVVAGAVQAQSLQLQLDNTSYLPEVPFVLDITGPVGSIAVIGLDTDPGPTTIPGIGTLNLGFSSNVLVLSPFVLTDGTARFSCTIRCDNPLLGLPISVQGVGFLQSAVFVSNTETINYSDPVGICGDCAPCDGKINAMIMEYHGAAAAYVEVEQKKPSQFVFAGTVAPGGVFSFIGTDKKGTLGTEIKIYVDGVLTHKVHTSCSQPIYPGMVIGDFVIRAASSRNGGPTCPQ